MTKVHKSTKQDAIYVEDLYDDNVTLRDENERLRALLRRLYEWDHMASAADGAYWRNEISKVLGRDKDGPRGMGHVP